MLNEMLSRFKSINFLNDSVKKQTLNYISGWIGNIKLGEFEDGAETIIEVLLDTPKKF